MSQINYPILSEYERAIKKSGSLILNLPEQYEFVANRTVPIKFFNFGSGSFAAVFKVKSSKGEDFALRCFLNGGDPKRIEHTKQIIGFLSNLSEPWLCKTKLYDAALYVNNHHFPAILMDWSAGGSLNNYVSDILHDSIRIENLQRAIVSLSHSLEKHGVAHGDIQSGNVLVEKNSQTINLKLVDYDAMYIPSFIGKKAVETGHSSFQHHKRTKEHFNHEIDRFSFWLILTALEALKYDKSLWNKDMQGGFNDGDNFLFKAKDISHPDTSVLVLRLRNLKQPSVDFYLNQLLSNTNNPQRNIVKLFGSNEPKIEVLQPKENEQKYASNKQDNSLHPIGDFKGRNFAIATNPTNLRVYIDEVIPEKLLGKTPINISIPKFSGRKIYVVLHKDKKGFILNPNKDFYYFEFFGQVPSEGKYNDGGKYTQETDDKVKTSQREKKYEIYSENRLKLVSLREIEDIFRSGRDLRLVVVDGTQRTVEHIPEINALRLKYAHQPIKESKPVTAKKTNSGSSSTLIIWFVVFAFISIVVFLVKNSQAKTEVIETVNASDTAALYYVGPDNIIRAADASAMPADMAGESSASNTPIVVETDELRYDNGDRYVGKTIDGRREGFGIYYWKDGSKYEGEWQNQIRNGKGTQYNSDGSKYVGQWKDDKENGWGTSYTSTGGRHEGDFRNGLKHGRGTFYILTTDPNVLEVEKQSGTWKNGEMDGEITMYWEGGNWIKFLYKNGIEIKIVDGS